MVQKGLTSNFQVSHSLSISQANTGYRFGATFVGTPQPGQGEPFPVLLGDTDLKGNTAGTILHQLGRYRMKFQGQVQKSKLTAAQLSVERRGRLSTLGMTLANLNPITGNGVFVTQYLRRLTERVDVGAEFVYQKDPRLQGGQISAISYAFRYLMPDYTFSATTAINSATASFTAAHLCYYHKQSENLQFGVELEANLLSQEAHTTFAYQIDIPDSLTLRACCDTNWTVGAVLEKKLSKQFPFTLALSGMLNHVKLQGKFGIGLIIG
ncbi:hypothetical protein Mgra_00001094 [Meloidogyne graminicola]|uniref:Mitochondrial import receptor subunit TOM40 homolog n=1 Tax=Meloidogyne graminicola TaxID=189291 RepID=A0A8T0A1M3_9BILA|nr:hypothetical protein Mgra_00001094 [Meloidogyne graminicola]